MSQGSKKSGEKLLARWSRLKQETQARSDAPPPAQTAESAAPPPELPPIDKLDMDSDFRGFFHPKVDENLRRAALRKLFSEPHFNVMDGLDVYIDDYSKPDPLPAAMLAQLKQAQKIIDWAREKHGNTGEESVQQPAGHHPSPVIEDAAPSTPQPEQTGADPPGSTVPGIVSPSGPQREG